ncbi:mtDNA inheritance, partitioning of the mitochondrial organelle [Stygiomarasmius scandens]|uniref:MtDNA inheritance, partitioning of the mitochondrial organelle n=1 Tax=Marasmiellus scandens TaxID=2682957 RepID=A0ABR1JB96_9AGAR
MLPDVPEWQNPEGDWTHGLEAFSKYNQDAHLMETSVRLFLEECDSFQGLQVTNDSSTFGSFTRSFLTAFQDELSHASTLTIPMLSDALPNQSESTTPLHMKKTINDALYLRDLHELSLLNVPIQSSKKWSSIPGTSLDLDGSLYHSSALLSAHVETFTLPLRLSDSKENLQNFAAELFWPGPRFGQLSGIFPAQLGSSFTRLEKSVNFSSGAFKVSNAPCFGCKNVTRGLTIPYIEEYNTWISTLTSSVGYKDAVITSAHLPAYPLPSSFPDFFQDTSILRSRIQNKPRSRTVSSPGEVPCVTSMSSLSSTSETANFFAAYAKYVDRCIERRKSGEQVSGIDEPDVLKELANDLWTMHDGYGIDADSSLGADDGIEDDD